MALDIPRTWKVDQIVKFLDELADPLEDFGLLPPQNQMRTITIRNLDLLLTAIQIKGSALHESSMLSPPSLPTLPSSPNSGLHNPLLSSSWSLLTKIDQILNQHPTIPSLEETTISSFTFTTRIVTGKN